VSLTMTLLLVALASLAAAFALKIAARQ
jgi:hypothetical protein